MKNCHKKLKELIEEVVIPDIEDGLDETFEKITKTKNSTEFEEHLKELHEMRDEFREILSEIEERSLSKEECVEIYEEITEMLSDEEED